MIDKLGFERGLKIIFISSLSLFTLIFFLAMSTDGYTLIGIIKISSFMSSWMILIGTTAIDIENSLEKRMILSLQSIASLLICFISYSYIILISNIL